MFKDIIHHVVTGFASLKPAPADVHRDIYGRVVERGDDFFHPQKFRGVPMFDVDSILRHYKPVMDKLRSHVDIGSQRKTPDGRSLYDALYVDVITRYVEFCHMIPASEDHHHAHTGGLLLHSLEASVEALRWAKEKDASITGLVDIDAKVKPVMNYCAWLAALLHDAGKLMRDISVNAVEVIHPVTKRPIKITSPIVSWHPARESLIEWAKHNNISAYSVSFLAGRTHGRHNIDSSQILQPLLRGQYAMDYLFSTPIKQEVYSDLTRVLSGYTTSADFLSESVRMGDSSSTSRSLGYLYDSRLGNRVASTAQRLYKTIKAASSDWDWNRKDGQGWILGGDVYLRWSSSIDNIIKVSVELGYSLPTDAKNVLNIMDSNLITDLFDRKSPNDRIIRFTPGRFTIEDALEIKSGTRQVQWHDLLKLRGPQVIFAEAPMPFSQAGLILLPNSKKCFLMTKEGDVIDIDQDTVSTDSDETGDGLKGKDEDAQGKLIEEVASSVPMIKNIAVKAPVKSKQEKQIPNEQNVGVMPSNKEKKKGLNGIVFVNQPLNHQVDAKESVPPVSDESQKSQPPEQVEIKLEPESSRKRTSKFLGELLDKNVSYYKSEGYVLIPTETATQTMNIPLSALISQLEKSGDLEINLSNPAIKTVMHHVGKEKVKCVRLSVKSSSHFPDNLATASKANDGQQGEGTTQKETPSISANCDRTDTPKSTGDTTKPKKVLTKHLISPDTSFIQDGKVYLQLTKAVQKIGISTERVLDVLQKRHLVSIEPGSGASITFHDLERGGHTVQCVQLIDKCGEEFLGFEGDLKFGTQPVTDTQQQDTEKSNTDASDTNPLLHQLQLLVDDANAGTLLKYLSTHDELHIISSFNTTGFALNHNALSVDSMKAINKTKLRNYMREHEITLTSEGYVLTAKQLISITMQEIGFDE